MSIRDFLKKQFIDVIHWTEPGDGILAYRYPMQDMEIQNGGQLTVRESQMAAFVNEGTIADIFQPGLYTLNTQTLPILTNLQNWDKAFQSPFKSDVYFFSTRLQVNQRWGTPNAITIRDKEFGAVRLRAFGIYSYRLSDPRISLPEELQALLDQRIGMNMVGDLNRYTQFQVAQSMPIAAANEGGGAAGVGVGLGAGLTMAQQMMNAMKPGEPQASVASAPTPAAETKFCQECGKSIPRSSKFCPECGKPQQ